MGKYIKKFDTHSDYEDFTETEDFIKPNVSYCVDNIEVHYNPYVHDYSLDYLTFIALENGQFGFNGDIGNINNTLSYSLDNGETWVSLTSQDFTPTINTGDKIMWKGECLIKDNFDYTPYYGIGYFISSCTFSVEGNPMSLLYGDDFVGELDLTGKNYAFQHLFMQSGVTNAENLSLSATTLAENCYQYMFWDCTALTTPPKLPATTLAVGCYSNMFQGCTSLTTPPELPATILTEGCYNNMFNGCSSLTAAPELPATTLAESCYGYMFNYCSSLTTVPDELPATTLAAYCYANMFYHCTSLTTAPVLPATTLVEDCYQYMFLGCTNLNYIKAMFTTTPSSTYTDLWVYSIASSGTFVKNAAAQWNVTGEDGIPTGWTVETATE